MPDDEVVYVCTACGKFHADRGKIGDESCYLNAQLCYKSSLQIRDGIVVFARAARLETAEV